MPWEPLQFPSRVVVVALLVHRLLVAVVHHVDRGESQPRLCVAHGGWRRPVDSAEVALLVDERVAHVEVLRHPNEGRVHHRFAVGVVVAGRVAGDLGALPELRPWAQIQVVHGDEDASLARLQTIPRVRQGALDDHAHRVREVGAPHLLVEEMIADLLGWRPSGRRSL